MAFRTWPQKEKIVFSLITLYKQREGFTDKIEISNC